MLKIESILYIIDASEFTRYTQSKVEEHIMDTLKRNKIIHRQRGKKRKNKLPDQRKTTHINV